jgi:hypothetical protein
MIRYKCLVRSGIEEVDGPAERLKEALRHPIDLTEKTKAYF